jgi:hypothetical protein
MATPQAWSPLRKPDGGEPPATRGGSQSGVEPPHSQEAGAEEPELSRRGVKIAARADSNSKARPKTEGRNTLNVHALQATWPWGGRASSSTHSPRVPANANLRAITPGRRRGPKWAMFPRRILREFVLASSLLALATAALACPSGPAKQPEPGATDARLNELAKADHPWPQSRRKPAQEPAKRQASPEHRYRIQHAKLLPLNPAAKS